MKKKSKKVTAVAPPEEPASTGKITDTPPLRKQQGGLVAKLSLNLMLSDGFIKRTYDLLQEGKTGKEAIEIIKNEHTLPEPPKEIPE